MSIEFKILGRPGKDNALLVLINSGKKLYRLLFDCGEDLLKALKYSEITSIDHLFFSHFHLDHAAGFDYFIRRNYDRNSKPVYIWGPEKTTGIIHHRLRGYTWNLVDGIPGTWYVNEISKQNITTTKFFAPEAFAKKHRVRKIPFTGIIIDNKDFIVEAVILDHIIPSIAYRITEKDSLIIDKEALLISGFQKGTWLGKVKDLSLDEKENISTGDKFYPLRDLRKLLLANRKGESISYLTDFIYNRSSRTNVNRLIKNCGIVICESQYAKKDAELAKRNFHLTTEQASSMAKIAGAEKLILFHISERYKIKDDYLQLLNEAREIFPNTFFPEEWDHELKRINLPQMDNLK